jgi:peptidoglycan-associated lipoprotein
MKVVKLGLTLSLVLVAALSISACATTKPAATSTTTTATGPAPGSVEEFTKVVGDRVFFDFDRYDVKDEGRATLQRQAEWLKKYAKVSVTLEGHCDERGTREYNLALGSRRATAAKDYLVSLGVDASRIKTISYGKEKPVCVESTESCWAQNRRAVTVIMSGAGA